jgi:hypothetical protein
MNKFEQLGSPPSEECSWQQKDKETLFDFRLLETTSHEEQKTYTPPESDSDNAKTYDSDVGTRWSTSMKGEMWNNSMRMVIGAIEPNENASGWRTPLLDWTNLIHVASAWAVEDAAGGWMGLARWNPIVGA